MADTNIKAVITADDKASSALKKFGDNVQGVGHNIARVAKVAAVATAAAGAAAVAFGVASVKAFTESEDAIAQTNAVLKSTKGIAGVTAKEIDKLSSSLQKVTKYSDEEIRSAQNMLLTFTSVGKKVFPQATETILDMSAALGQDLKSSTIQLGKALQDPIKGITALRRVGVNFSDSQQEVIKGLVKSGKTMEAQKLILKELQTEFGGSAKAAGKTFSGQLIILKNSLNDVQEKVGETIVKYLAPFAQKALDAVASIDWDAVIQRTIQALRDFREWLIGAWNEINKVGKAVGEYLSPKFRELWDVIKKEVIPTLQKLWKEVLEPLMPVIGTTLVIAIGLAIDALRIMLSLWSSMINEALKVKDSIVNNWNIIRNDFIKSKNQVEAVAKVIGDKIELIKKWFNGLPSPIKTALKGVTEAIFKPFRTAFEFIKAGIDSVNKSFNDLKKNLGGGGGSPVKNVLKGFIKSIPGLPGFASGTDFAPGGMAMVGERGPELVNLPRGSRVTPNEKIGKQGTTVNVSFNGVFTGSQMEFRQLAVKLSRALEDAKGMGTV